MMSIQFDHQVRIAMQAIIDFGSSLISAQSLVIQLDADIQDTVLKRQSAKDPSKFAKAVLVPMREELEAQWALHGTHDHKPTIAKAELLLPHPLTSIFLLR